MAAVRHKHRDFIQNIAIVALSLSAVALFAQTQLFHLASGQDGVLSRLMGGETAQPTISTPQALTDLTVPVRVAVSGTYGRYGNTMLTTTDSGGAFAPLGTLLGETLSATQAFTQTDAAHFRTALDATSIYYDFLEPLPLPILAGLVGGETAPNREARRLVISAGGEDTVWLYLWDGAESYVRCSVAIPLSYLTELVGAYELGNAFFAFDNGDMVTDFAALDPYSLFSETLPPLPALSSSRFSDTDVLLSTLGFNPNTNSRYTDSSGTEVVLGGDRTLHIRTDGVVLYQSGGDPSLSVDAAGDSPTAAEAVLGVSALLSRLENGVSFYLQSVRQAGDGTTLQFGQHLNGVPIRLSSGAPAAEITLTGKVISTFSLSLRQYAVTGEASPLLPLRQALAIAADNPGRELFLGYADYGTDTVSAAWLLDG